MIDDPLDFNDVEDDVEAEVSAALRSAPLPPIPDRVRKLLDDALQQAQVRREAGETAQAHSDGLAAAALRSATGTFGPNPLNRKRLPRRPGTPRTIGA